MLGKSDTARFEYLRIRCKSCSSFFCGLYAAVDEGWLSFGTLKHLTETCMSLTMAVRPASLWDHALFAAYALEVKNIRHE